MPENRPRSRFAADVDYSGRAGRHDYVVHARHRLLDTTFTVAIDGVEHDPKAEEKARAAREGTEKYPEADASGGDDSAADGDAAGAADGNDGAGTDGVAAADGVDGDDGAGVDGAAAADGNVGAGADGADGDDGAGADGDDLRFTLQDGFTTLRCTVRRPREDEDHKDAEVITVHTAGLGGAGEVEIRHGFQRTVLVPAEGSPSAARDAKRTAHPTRYALVAALTKSARFLLPLFGLGALFSGLLDPLEEWIEARLRPAVDAIARATEPPREWIAQLLQPIQDFIAAVLQPIRDFLAALLQPVRDLLGWLLGLLPDVELPFDVPGWLVDVLIAAVVVVAVFTATRRGLQERRQKLEATKAAGSEAPDDAPDQAPDVDPADATPPAVPARAPAEQEATDPTIADRQVSGT